jgi:hypothetical protein
MSYSRKVDWDDISDERMMEYLLTWLTVCGSSWTGMDEACEVDTLIDDEDEQCWNVALGEGFITKHKSIFHRYKLTKVALTYIKGKQNETI